MSAALGSASNASLVAAVFRAGGIGCFGRRAMTASHLQKLIDSLRKLQIGKEVIPFAVSIAMPSRTAGGDSTLDELVRVTIKNSAKLFVAAVGIPPVYVIEALHGANIPVMNMVGTPEHARRALASGVDMVCAQGSEAGGHTSSIPSSVLIPAVVDVTKGYISSLTGLPVLVIAAGAIYDGRSLARCLMLGASGVWVGTRLLASNESGADQAHKSAVVTADFGDTLLTQVITGRPVRMKRNLYLENWQKQQDKLQKLLHDGIVPMEHDIKAGKKVTLPFSMGEVSALVTEIQSVETIIRNLINGASQQLLQGSGYVKSKI